MEARVKEILKMLEQEADLEKMSHGRGKPDDITVVAAWVALREQAPVKYS